MIIGNALMASALRDSDRDDIIFFASGVSNSFEIKESEFRRKFYFLLKTIAENFNKMFVYFSSSSIYDLSKHSSPCVLHKLKMEQMVKYGRKKQFIFQVGNGGNPNQIFRCLLSKVCLGESITVHSKAIRNLINSADIKEIVLNILQKGQANLIINIAYLHNYKMKELMAIISREVQKKPKLIFTDAASGYEICIKETSGYFEGKNLENKELYLVQPIKK